MVAAWRRASGRTGLASAISRPEQAVAANPDDHQARFDLAVALSAKGERDAARATARNHPA